MKRQDSISKGLPRTVVGDSRSQRDSQLVFNEQPTPHLAPPTLNVVVRYSLIALLTVLLSVPLPGKGLAAQIEPNPNPVNNTITVLSADQNSVQFSNLGIIDVLGNGTLTNFGTMNNDGGAITVGTSGTYYQTASIGTSSRTINNGTFTNAGHIDLAPAYAIFTNSAGGRFVQEASGSTFMTQFSGFSNAGQATIGGRFDIYEAATYFNSGTTRSNGSFDLISGDISNGGTFANEGRTYATGGERNSGGILNRAGGVYENRVTGTVTLSDTALFANRGIVVNDGKVELLPGGTFVQERLQQDAPVVPTTVNTGTFTNNVGTVSIEAGTFANNGNLTNAGTFQVASLGQVTGNGSYVQTAAGAQTIVNGTFVNNIALQQGLLSGTGTVTGSVVNTGGVVRPGGAVAPGTLMLASYTQGTNGRLDFRIGGLLAGTQYDVLRINGPVTLNGTVQVSLTNNFQPNVGDRFNILRSDRITLGQVNFSLPSLPSRETWLTNIVGNLFELSVAQAHVSAPEPNRLLLMLLGVMWLMVWQWRCVMREKYETHTNCS
ncbi:MAG TPA: hypothetical protein VFQ34_13240 [Nitrospiraceae bacterium]|nr:hypothetical protein [Nitrospiraceae bacterium]